MTFPHSDRQNFHFGRWFHHQERGDGDLGRAIFGSVRFCLALLTGGVLFVSFVGTLVAAGPLGAALLGATSGRSSVQLEPV